jgi:hypothetical protein
MPASDRISLSATELLHTQFQSDALDADDAYIVDMGSATDLFPNSTTVNNIQVGGVCNLTRSQCDTSDVYWKYSGHHYYNMTYCNSNLSSGT